MHHLQLEDGTVEERLAFYRRESRTLRHELAKELQARKKINPSWKFRNNTSPRRLTSKRSIAPIHAKKSERGSPTPNSKGSAIKRQGSIKGGKYIRADAEQPSAPKLELSQPGKKSLSLGTRIHHL